MTRKFQQPLELWLATSIHSTKSDTMFEVMNVAWQHAGRRLRPFQKIKLAKQLKHIQKDSRAAVSKVLTPEKLQAWDKLKEQARQQQKKG